MNGSFIQASGPLRGPSRNWLIRGGRVWTPEGPLMTDLLIENGRIARFLSSAGPAALYDKYAVLEAEGCELIPGGIDPHVHMQLPTQAGMSSDDFESGSRAALLGGTTVFFDFVTPLPGQGLVNAMEQRLHEAAYSACDYGLHISPTRIDHIGEMAACLERGAVSFKVYMAYKQSIGLSDTLLMRVLREAARLNSLVLVHAEEGDQIEMLRGKMFEKHGGHPRAHPLSRPSETESRAVRRLIDMVRQTGCRVYIVHVSTAESVRLIAKAQREGLPVYAEACPHHLLLDAAMYEADFDQSAKAVMSPPLRSEADRDALWQGLAVGILQTVGTDHCPFHLSQKRQGVSDFRLIPNGAGSVEWRLSLMYTYGVMTGRISMHQWIALMSGNAASVLRLSPEKGQLIKGADADIVIWDPHINHTISADNQHQHCDHSLFEGWQIHGWPRHVLRRGELAVKQSLFTQPGSGRFLGSHR